MSAVIGRRIGMATGIFAVLAACGGADESPPPIGKPSTAPTATPSQPDAGTTAPSTPSFAAPTCTDGAQNGNETGVDCGGSCPACALCQSCKADGDCTTGACKDGLCAPTITNVKAVYAANCGAPTPVPTIAAACEKKQSCNYVFNYTVDIGSDPAYGCYKALTVEYSCTGSATKKTYTEACAPCDPQNTPTQIKLDLDCAPCVGPGKPPA